MLIRSFNPVGQGAFYTEQFDEATVVFDCGTSTAIGSPKSNSVRFIENEIRNLFEEGQIIDAVFISHLHVDHMNGLEFLLKHCQVKKVYLPLLTESQKAIHLINVNCSGSERQSEFTVNVIINPFRVTEVNRESETEVHLVKSMKHDISEIEIVNIESKSGKVIDSGTEIFTPRDSDWVYVPFNFDNDKNNKQFLEALGKRGISIDKDGMFICAPESRQISLFQVETDATINETKRPFIEIWGQKDLRDRICIAYNEVKGGLNTNSMTVFSGPTKGYHSRVESICFSGRTERGYNRRGCLYLGDYNAKGKENWLQLYDAYSRFSRSIGICQIPHHGSSHNYNEKLVTDFGASELIISAGYDNQYRHPHASVVNNIIRNRKNLHIVSEQIGSAFRINYSGV